MKWNRERLHAAKDALRHPDFRTAGKKLMGAVTEGWYVQGDPMSRDRVRLLGYDYEANIVANLIGGTFYTGLLLLLNADDAFIGSMSLISTAANMLQVFAPLLLERFPKRKKLLVGMRSLIMLFNVLLLGLIPVFPVGQQARLTLFAGTVLIVNVLNAFCSPGFTVWHVQSLPPNTRGSFYTLVMMTRGAVVALFNLLGSALVDAFTARGDQYTGLLILRLFCIALVALDTVSYSKIREYPYESGGSFTLRDLVLSPLKEKRYLRTVAMTFLWNISANIPGSYHTVYMLKDVGVSYSFIMIVSMLNVPVVLLLTPVWSRLGKKLQMSWFKMLYVAMGLYLLYYVMLSFVTAQTLWLYPIALLWAYVIGIGINLSFACIPYVNIPAKNQTAFIGFYAACANLAAFIGVFIGREFVTRTEELRIGMFTSKQLLLLLTAALMAICVIVIRRIDQINTKEEKEKENIADV